MQVLAVLPHDKVVSVDSDLVCYLRADKTISFAACVQSRRISFGALTADGSELTLRQLAFLEMREMQIPD